MNTIAVFKSRTNALAVYRYLLNRKIACATINTPSRLHLGCGISVVFPSAYQGEVKKAIDVLGIQSFVGFFTK